MQANDITYQEWQDLGRLCMQLDVGGCPMMGGSREQGGKSGEQGAGSGE
jgi:hypothetical protein